MSFQDIRDFRRSPCFIDVLSLTGGISDEFYRSIVPNPMTFSEAVNFCVSTGGTLARVSTKEEFDIGNNMKSGEVWIGMRREEDSEEDPKSFLFIDNVNENKSFYEIGNKLPWNSNEPRFGNSFCVQWQAGNINAWDDLTCDSTRIPLCRRSCSSPTTTPTINPTFFPSLQPSFSPTSQHTLSPTLSPVPFSLTETPTSLFQSENDDFDFNEDQTIFFSLAGTCLLLFIVLFVLTILQRNISKKIAKKISIIENRLFLSTRSTDDILTILRIESNEKE